MGRKRKEKSAVDLEPEPPDSGWAWVVMCSVFIGHFMVVGFLASVSVYVYVWIAFFGGSAAETSLVISICSFLMGAYSPIAGAICKRFGPRVTAMVGGTITGVGVAVSSQSTGIIFLIISLGFFTAFGMSMVMNAGYTGLGMYFKKRLALAIGLATAGTSLGQLALPPLFQYLIDQYGWRGSLLITSALAFHVVAAGALIRPLVRRKQKRSSDKLKSSNCSQSTEVGNTGLSFLNPSIFGSEDFVCSPGDTTLGEGSIFQGDPNVAMTTDEPEDEDTIEYVDSWNLSEEGDMTAMNSHVWVPVAITTLGNLPKKRRGTSFIPERKPRSASMLSQDLVKQSSDLIHLLRNPSFLVMLAVGIAHGFGWASTTYHLVSRAESVNIEPDNAALLLTLMGAGSFIGRLSIGWIVDRNWMRPELYYTLAFAVCALATFITPLITEFQVLVAVALVHGLSGGVAAVIVIMTPRLIVKPSLASTSTAYFFLAWGVGEISGGALAGWFYDALKSYDYSFYTAGSVMIAGCGLMLIIYFLQRAKRQRQRSHTYEEQAGPVQPGSNQLDLELAGSKHDDDLGRVNPVYFLSQGFETRMDQCESEIMGESVPGYKDADLTTQSCQSNSAFDWELSELREDDVGECLGIENPINENDSVEVHANYPLASQIDTYAEVHEHNIKDIETPSSVTGTGPIPQISPKHGDSDSPYTSEEESVVGFENPGYEGKSGNASRTQDPGKVEHEFSGVTVVDRISDQEDSGIENKLYFGGECCDTESVSSECWDSAADSTGEYTECETGVQQANHMPQMAQDSVDNQKQDSGHEFSDEDIQDEHYNDQTNEKIATSDFGLSNPCYISVTSVDEGPCGESEFVEGSLDVVLKRKCVKKVAEDSRGGKKQFIVTEEMFL